LKYLSEVRGRSGTVARVVAYSQAANSGTKLITFEYEAYRGILAELNTHCMLPKNAESSRAVPIKKRIEAIRNTPYVPIVFGSNKAGMQAGEEIDTLVKVFNPEYDPELGDDGYRTKEVAWKVSANRIADIMQAWEDAGYHKQIVNRIGEAFTTVKGVLTATEWDNFWHLRRDEMADPAIKELADCMWKAKKEVEDNGLIEILQAGEWHTPYVEHRRSSNTGELMYTIGIEKLSDINAPHILNISTGELQKILTLEEALKISSVACGQVSFRKLDTSEETVERVWDRLMGGAIIHASVTQHQGTPMSIPVYVEQVDSWEGLFNEDGITHIDKNYQKWSAQFKHWIMFRKTIPNEACWNYEE